MPTTMPRVIGMLSARVDPATKDVILAMEAEDKSPYELRLHPGVVSGLAVALFALGFRIAAGPNAPEMVGQVMTLTGARPAVGPQGELVLDLVLEDALHFAVTFPPEGILGLQTALAELQNATNAARSAPPATRH